jgi:hypothetical protein
MGPDRRSKKDSGACRFPGSPFDYEIEGFPGNMQEAPTPKSRAIHEKAGVNYVIPS